MGYKKYNWVGNRIDDADMKKLYQLKQKIKKPLTILVREAVKEYIENNEDRL